MSLRAPGGFIVSDGTPGGSNPPITVTTGNPHTPLGRRLRSAGAVLVGSVLLAAPATATRAAVPPAAAQPPAMAITDPVQIWPLSNEEKSVAHPIRFEGRVSFVDPKWRHLWLERDGLGEYIVLSVNPPPLRQGQRVRIEGTLVPFKGLDASAVTVTVLQADEPATALSAMDRLSDVEALNNRIVAIQAYVDGERLVDGDHLRLNLVVGDQPVVAWVKPDNPKSLPDWQGKFIRMTGLYSGRFDATRTEITLEIWTARQSDVTVDGSIDDSGRFDVPRTPISELHLAPTGREVKISGRVQSDAPGSQLVVRDDTGQVVVQSVQQQRVPSGAPVEAIGRLAFSGNQWTLRAALFRVPVLKADGHGPTEERPAALTTIEGIRQLSVEEAARGLPVDITGSVTWSDPHEDFFFLADITGGIRVRFRHGLMEVPQRYKYLRIEGVSCSGGFAPAVELRRFQDLGTMNPPEVQEITFEQAITGDEDGQLVYMTGIFQRTESEGIIRRIHAATPGGEFVALLESPVGFTATPGSLIRVRGVCEAVPGENGQISGIVLRTPSLPELIVEHDAPADFYNLPLRSVAKLRQLSSSRELTRVHMAGTVLYAVTGRLAYVAEGGAAILVLSRETEPLSPGDRIEAVGLLGSEGVRVVLRGASYRKLASGPEPRALEVANPSRLSITLDSHLVRMRGVLIETLGGPDRTRLTLQSGSTLFEAVLDKGPGRVDSGALALGAGLEVTGIYRVSYDDLHQLRGFQLQLRSPADIAVFQEARLWTLPRALAAAGVLGGCTLLGLGWVTALRARVKRQTAQIRAQLERQMKLEAELQHAARLESLGVLAGGIAHDFNNLLTVIMGNVSLAMLDEKVMASGGESLRAIQKGAVQARDLTHQLLTFAKGGSPVRSTVSLSDVVHATTEFILRGSSARCEFDIPADLWSASVDKEQTAQVVQNLVLNAVQAMANGGVVRIALRNEAVSPGFKAALAPGRYIRLTVADTGEGIGKEIIPRIFDPYFSTKKTGSGLGLATVYSVVRRHQGHIEVESVRGMGTTFTVWLPAAEADAEVAPDAEPAGADVLLPGKPARILLMDDDESIRQFCGAALRRMGLEVTLVGDGAEAVRQFSEKRAAGRPFDLLILDLTIPGGMGGKATIEVIRRMDPAVPAIVSSGYSNDPVLADFKSFGFQAMVSKPYEVAQLAKATRDILAAQRN